MMAKPALVVIAGATATGKSDTAIEAAKRIGGEIVSADSMQVYRGMDIGTGKVMPQEMQGVPHHLIDVCGPDDAYDLARYAADASEAIRGILERGRIPILCGGTGFYIQAVTKGIAFDEASPSEDLRKELLEEAKTEGNEALHRRLCEVDPVSAAAIHPNNVKRVIRALEYYR
ncbi:MAG: tRNA (adenosine(37)-N6)-dimethylallyltransferase MiaA, partial [Lachnospiraceae bacterium]|nr:tRNA (adenosine(37)-N6)-dimethylallyltransferase MiaA [Lachnospiraceae bacterium]